MAKVKIEAREAVADIKAGIHDSDLMTKYNFSAKGLDSLFRKLMEAGLLVQVDLDRRLTLRENTNIPDLTPLPSRQLGWKFEAGDVVGTPAVASGVIYFGSWDGNLCALDIKTGREKWRFKTKGAGHAKPVISGQMICVGVGITSSIVSTPIRGEKGGSSRPVDQSTPLQPYLVA